MDQKAQFYEQNLNNIAENEKKVLEDLSSLKKEYFEKTKELEK